jgi:alkylhydroperoxidase family enzyme
MVVCRLCAQEVSKRSTLSLDVLGAGGGRACRSHKQVAQLADQLAETLRIKRQWTAAERNLRIISAVAGIQVLVTVTGITESVMYARLRMAGYDEGMLAEIRREVDRLGGPALSTVELGAMMLAGISPRAQ